MEDVEFKEDLDKVVEDEAIYFISKYPQLRYKEYVNQS